MIKRNRQVLENYFWAYNLQNNYVDKDDPQTGIIDETLIIICFTNHRLRVKIHGQLVFGNNIIFPIKHIIMGSKLICQCNQAQIPCFSSTIMYIYIRGGGEMVIMN